MACPLCFFACIFNIVFIIATAFKVYLAFVHFPENQEPTPQPGPMALLEEIACQGSRPLGPERVT
jgi:hypothetical protein